MSERDPAIRRAWTPSMTSRAERRVARALMLAEIACFLALQVSAPLWGWMLVGIRLAELMIPIAFFATLPGWRRLACLPGAAMKCWFAGMVLQAVTIQEIVGREFVCLHAGHGDAQESCMFGLAMVFPLLFWGITRSEIHAVWSFHQRHGERREAHDTDARHVRH